MVIGINEALIGLGFPLFLTNLVLGILVLAKDDISKKFKIFLGICLIILSLLGLLVFLIGLD